MQPQNVVQQPTSNGKAVAALVLGIMAIVLSFVPLLGAILGVVAIILGTLSMKSAQNGKALAGIITGSIGILFNLFAVLVLIFSITAVQKNARDTARKSDLNILASNIVAFQTQNGGELPSASDIKDSNLLRIGSVTDTGEPTTDTAVYTVGENCDGNEANESYKLSIVLESGLRYCLDA